ncbi:MAG: XRE family transcriptional regulator [Bdellovibrionales bacterium]|nr:XRE family transcriptional regulator [Bdellovibrionales bacterium]
MAVESIKKVKISKEQVKRREEILKEIAEREKKGEFVGSRGFDKSDPIQRVKWSLCLEILIAKRLLGLSSKEVAEIINLDKSRTSEIMHYKFDQFTIDRLLNCFLAFKGRNAEVDRRIEKILTVFSPHIEAG